MRLLYFFLLVVFILSFALSYLPDSFHSTFPLHSCFPLMTQENEEQWVWFAEGCVCKRIWFHSLWVLHTVSNKIKPNSNTSPGSFPPNFPPCPTCIISVHPHFRNLCLQEWLKYTYCSSYDDMGFGTCC